MRTTIHIEDDLTRMTRKEGRLRMVRNAQMKDPMAQAYRLDEKPAGTDLQTNHCNEDFFLSIPEKIT
jgi:hypothetical protein